MSLLPSVVDPFFAIARADPDRPAITDNGSTVGYGQLARWAGAVADLVATRAPGPQPPVAIVTHHSARDVAAILGVLAAGRAYVPVTDAPGTHMDEALRALGCREAVTTTETGRLPAVDRLLRPNWGASRAPVREAGEPVRADDPAYVLFTSGSTGAPKAAAVPHGALHAVIPELRTRYGAGPDTVALNFHRADGDTSLEEILPTLCAGGLLVIDEDSETLLGPLLTDAEITLVNLPVDYWHTFTGHVLEHGLRLPDSLDTVVIGGEAVRPDMLERWHRLGADRVRLLNTYGSTETALVTHSVLLAGPGAAGPFADGVPIGHPLPTVRQAVVPRDEEPGGPGELFLAGPQLATGYVDDPERTAARFVEADFGDGPARWYRTGDLVREGAHGMLVFQGRADHQVKIRGHRVDLPDVEHQIGRLPGVSAVAAAEHVKGDHNALVAFVVFTPDAAPDVRALREELKACVPAFLVPDRIVAVSALAHTRTGKVDRAATRDLFL
ncbi:AMP-binding protein [Streptomyces sp. NPDC046685]|uniref:AMP-binding protein n=1 Tax=Streptomyces sp. NPDC046685 TaxID=3157202 RepID=UPI003411CAEC